MVVWGHLAFDLTQGPVCSLERVIFTKLDSSDVIFSIPCISHCVILLPRGCSGFDMMIARKLPHDRSSYIGLRTKLPVGTSTGLVLWSDWCLWGFCVSTHFTAYKLRDNLFFPLNGLVLNSSEALEASLALYVLKSWSKGQYQCDFGQRLISGVPFIKLLTHHYWMSSKCVLEDFACLD